MNNPAFFRELLLSLLSAGAGAIVQCWFFIRFCALPTKKRYYFFYLLLTYLSFWVGILGVIPVSPILDTLLGVAILFFFIRKILGQNSILSLVAATLAMAVNTFVESAVTLLCYLLPPALAPLVSALLAPVLSLGALAFFVKRYPIKAPHREKYLLVFSLPMFFIAMVLRTVNFIRYSVTSEGFVLKTSDLQNYEMLLLTLVAFFCICATLFAYEKALRELERERANTLLQLQIEAQKRYVVQAREKYERTRAFRHDFKNHLIALRGLLDRGEGEKAAAYLDRFAQVGESLAFPVTTGNPILDILLSEKLAQAKARGITVQCDVHLPPTVALEDFDLCALFANALDNAIKASTPLLEGERSIIITARQKDSFFILDMENPHRPGQFPKGSGMGLATIRAIVDRCHGAVEIMEGEERFRITILLPF